jgi:hypothetical protein
MKSPFPGMDPYIEAYWSNVHVILLAAIQEALQPLLPRGLRARAEEQVMLESTEGEPIARYRPDVAVVERGRRDSQGAATPATISVPAPYTVRFFEQSQVDRNVQIIDTTDGNRVVTAIEVLSPWNKAPGRANGEYRRKLKGYAEAGVNLVEIDLLRNPRGRLSVDVVDLPPERRTPYLIAVRPGDEPERWDVYSVSLRSPIPPVYVPLRPSDAPVVLQLQPLIERVYAAGAYGEDIDYSKPPDPPLSPDDEAWADELLRKAGRR